VDVQYLGLGDLLVIASAVLGIEAEVLAKATNQRTSRGVRWHRVLPGLRDEGRVLGYRLARNHALPDGNKRTAFLAMVEFVERNGRHWKPLDEDDVVETMVNVAAGTLSEEAFIRWVGDRLEPA